jgi:hypothetical protein
MKKTISYIGTALILTFTSCADFLDINDSPNSPTAVTPSVLLPSGLVGTAFANGNELNRFASTVVSVTAGAAGSPAAYDVYNIDGANFGNQWRFEVYRSLITYDKLIEAGAAVNSKSYQGIAKIMKAYTFALATDVWGDIPYSEALLGATNSQPKLDPQEKIYLGGDGVQSLFDLVKDGLNDLSQTSTVNPGADDVIYGGNLANWRRAGNSLLLKLANTISRKNPDFAKNIINQVIADNNFIVANNQNLNVKFGSAVGSRSPIFEYSRVSLFQNDMLISTRFVTLLQSKNDPRLPLFVTRPTGDFVTIDNGFRGTLPQPQTSWSKFGDYVTGATGEGPIRLLTNAQTSFILAESALSLGTSGSAETYYIAGIRASMSDAGLTTAQIDAYFSANPDEVSLNGTDQENLAKIMTQKYIALYGNGLEQWNDFRRTGLPALTDHQNAVGIDGTRPVRAQYINEEIARNPNFQVVLPNVRVWWDID